MLSKTLRARAAKTGWARKRWLRLAVGLLVVLASFFVLSRLALAPSDSDETVRLRVQDKTFRLAVADEPAEHQQGLSGRERLAVDGGMLFVFKAAGEHCFWMKDMRFALDIIWLDAEKRIIDFKQNVDPATYPESFCPASPARYVLEFNAGTADQLGLKPGQQLSF